MKNDVEFDSGGVTCAAWHFPGAVDALARGAGRPCVVMAGGLSVTRDSALDVWAERLAAAGTDVLLFDFRGFGASGGQPRQVIDVVGQGRDYHAAIACARRLPGVDPTGIVLWGVSLAGGHVFKVAAEDAQIAAVVAVTPAVDGPSSLRIVMKQNGVRTTVRLLAAAARDGARALSGRQPLTIPVVGPSGSAALFTGVHARAGYAATSGPTWRNEVAARIALLLAWYRPITHAASLTCPVLVQIADLDTLASAVAAAKAAWRARANVRHYPCDHIDVLPGMEWFEPTVQHQIDFLRRYVASADVTDAELAAA